MSTKEKTTSLLLILDGWGHREEASNNAIAMADTPNWDRLLSEQPHTLIHTSGLKVGLPDGQMGNSEVGHMNLGAGRIVYQNLTRINRAIDEGDFFKNSVLVNACRDCSEQDKTLHIIGLLSPGGIHSHEKHILALIELAEQQGCNKIMLHALLDGRDTPPRSAGESIRNCEARLRQNDSGRIASLCGRYYAMDRDERWDRIERAFRCICHGQADHHYSSTMEALDAAYDRAENDEFVTPSIIHEDDQPPPSIEDGDAVIFMNFRADRARELSQVFVDDVFEAFDRGQMPALSHFVTLTEYSTELDAECAFPPEVLKNGIGEYLAAKKKTQLRIAETEKYAHVTFFFSGGQETPYKGEERILIPSPQVATYDLQPEMSVDEVTDKLVEAINSGKHDLIVCNFANGDMVGHTGVLDATIQAVEAVDKCLGRIAEAILANDGHCLITADHGNAEQMVDTESGQPLTSHTSGPVPLVYLGKKALTLKDDGALSDIAPSLLTLMGLKQPAEMTGHSLVTLQ